MVRRGTRSFLWKSFDCSPGIREDSGTATIAAILFLSTDSWRINQMAYAKSYGECDATGKKKYLTEKDACKAAEYANSQNKLRGENYILEPFKCEYCGYWHFGKKKEEVSTLSEYVEETKVLTTEEMIEKLRSLGYGVTPPEQVAEMRKRWDFYKKFITFCEENA